MAAPILPNEKSSLTLSSYELVPDSKEKPSKLGTGSFACVRLAREKKSGKHFALKIINLNPEKLSKADLYYLRTEIQIHRQLDHPNVVKFHGYAQEGFKLYFALDYAEKGNLYTYIQNNKVLTPNEVFNFFYQTCLAVQYIHENNVMHRDIKPENILIDKDLNIKLCDFGWSARNIRDKRTTLCGTYEYMAPEIVWKKPYDYRIDIWSLGVLLYELIHREAPYKGRSLAEITESFKKPLLSFARDIQPEVKDLIQKILKIDAEERISISDILSHTWVKYHLMKREYSQRIANASSSSNARAKTAESSLSPRFKQNFYMNQLQIGSKVQQKDKDKSMCLPINMTQPQQEQSRDGSPMVLAKSAATTPRVLQADRSMVMDRSVVIEKKVVADKTENIMQSSKTLATTESESNLMTSISYLNTSYSEKALGYSSSTLPKKLAEKWAETTKNSNDPAGNRRLFQKDIMSPDFNTKLNGILQQLNASVANRKHLSMMSGILSPQSQNQNQDKGTQLNVTFLQNSRESRGVRQALTKENNHNMTCDFSNIQLDNYKVKYNAGRGASRFNLNNSNLRLDTIQSNAEQSLNSSITTLKANFIGRQKAETTKASYQKYFAFESGLSSQKTNESYLSRTALDSTLDSSMLTFSKRTRGEGYSSPFSIGNELHRKLTLKLDNSISYKTPTGVQSTKNKENKIEFFRAQSLMENLLSQR